MQQEQRSAVKTMQEQWRAAHSGLEGVQYSATRNTRGAILQEQRGRRNIATGSSSDTFQHNIATGNSSFDATRQTPLFFEHLLRATSSLGTDMGISCCSTD